MWMGHARTEYGAARAREEHEHMSTVLLNAGSGVVRFRCCGRNSWPLLFFLAVVYREVYLMIGCKRSARRFEEERAGRLLRGEHAGRTCTSMQHDERPGPF